MLFWFVAALLTLGASLAVLLPLTARAEADGSRPAPDLEVYRDQLAEVDRDAARGLIGAAEAEEARAEIGRRILRLDREAGAPRASGSRKLFAAAAVLAVPVLSWSLYGALGSPEKPSQPLAARLSKDPAQSTPEELLARAEVRLRANPDDGAGWDAVAPAYLRFGRFDEAAESFRRAIRLNGATAPREAGVGEALTGKAEGQVTPEAEAAFERARALDPRHPLATFRLAQAAAQEGRIGEALAAWRRMQGDLPADSPWRSVVADAIAAGETRMAGGPSPEQVEAASAMTDEERSAMIEGMVATLDARLREAPDDAEGWRTLVRSYAVLGRANEAREALSRGAAALGEGSDGARQLGEFARALGVEREARP